MVIFVTFYIRFGGWQIRAHFIVKKNAYCWRVGVVVLSGSAGPEKGRQEDQCQQDAAADQKVDHVHNKWFFLAYRRAAMLVNKMMVTVLMGIKMAAINGDNMPCTAKYNPRAL